MDDRVQLTDLEVITRYSLAVRTAAASRSELIDVLLADVRWLQEQADGGAVAESASPAVREPGRRAPAARSRAAAATGTSARGTRAAAAKPAAGTSAAGAARTRASSGAATRSPAARRSQRS